MIYELIFWKKNKTEWEAPRQSVSWFWVFDWVISSSKWEDNATWPSSGWDPMQCAEAGLLFMMMCGNAIDFGAQ